MFIRVPWELCMKSIRTSIQGVSLGLRRAREILLKCENRSKCPCIKSPVLGLLFCLDGFSWDPWLLTNVSNMSRVWFPPPGGA